MVLETISGSNTAQLTNWPAGLLLDLDLLGTFVGVEYQSVLIIGDGLWWIYSEELPSLKKTSIPNSHLW